jgi:SAM-dependent methyltransferase
MNASKGLRWASLALCFAALSAVALGQAPQVKDQFEPQVGQAGKDVVWVPTPQELVDKMLDIAKVTPQDHVIDLGSGDGRTVITAAKRGARAMGIEYDPNMVELSKRNAAREKLGERATFQKADLFQSDFSQATVITMFLLEDINIRLRPKILDLKPGTRIVSNTFTMGDWKADEMVSVTGECQTWCTARLWIVPAKVEGTWRLPEGELRLKQTYQEVSGTLGSGTNAVTIADGKLRGNEISFTARGALYTGTIAGNTIQGTVKSGANTNPWRATR